MHIIPSLQVGGAETMLQRLVTFPDSLQYHHRVLCLGSPTSLGASLSEAGIEVDYLNVHAHNPLSLFRLLLLGGRVNRFGPDVIHTWMYHANAIVALCVRARVPVVWAIRHDLTDTHAIKRLTKWVISVGAWLSKKFPARIVSVSNVGVESHVAIGYEASKFIVIPNGFAIPELGSERTSVTEELGLVPTTKLIGLFARYHPIKDHYNFIEAAAILAKKLPDVHFLLAGKGIDWTNPELNSLIRSRELINQIHLLGERSDINELLSSLTVCTLSSRSEAFPLTIGEAMAMAVPCVATNVGDTAYLIGDTGLLVPPGNPQALAEAWAELLALPPRRREAMGQAARKRIRQHFSLEAMVARYNSLYETVRVSSVVL
ncbi:MAG: glycosyltransferase [Anaerolineales bacterium]|nr:MAG: glycosyltransferase [Anaerolineales bacterium]